LGPAPIRTSRKSYCYLVAPRSAFVRMRLESIQLPKPFQAGALARVSSIGDIIMGPYSGGSLARPQSAAMVARFEDAGGRRVRPSMADRYRSVSVALSKYARLRAARYQAGQYRNMSADWGKPEAAGRQSARRDQLLTQVGRFAARLRALEILDQLPQTEYMAVVEKLAAASRRSDRIHEAGPTD